MLFTELVNCLRFSWLSNHFRVNECNVSQDQSKFDNKLENETYIEETSIKYHVFYFLMTKACRLTN